MAVGLLNRWKEMAKRLQVETYTLYLAYRNPRTPWYARVWSALVAAYAFSPVDLIPDFIPVVGYLDDLVLIPLGVALALKMIPEDVYAECKAEATQKMAQGKLVNRAAGVVIGVVWLMVLVLLIRWLVKVWK